MVVKYQRSGVYRVSASLLEVIDRGDGEIVVQRTDSDAEPLVTIRFSDDARAYMLDSELEVAKAMIQAGIQAAAVISERGNTEVVPPSDSQRILH